MSSVLERMKARMSLQTTEPERPERPDYLRFNLDRPMHLLEPAERRRLIVAKLYDQFEGKRPRIISVLKKPLQLAHQKHTDGTCRPACIACDLEQKAAHGRPVMRYLVVIECDHPYKEVLVQIKRFHKKNRSGHKRIQKKWNALDKGKMELGPLREEHHWQFTEMQFLIFRDVYKSLGGLHAQIEIEVSPGR